MLLRPIAALPLLLTLLTAPSAARASQFVVLDITYTHKGTGSEPSHNHVLPPYPGGEAPPSNWTSPLDYAHGTAHFRLEVKSKPSSVAINYETCFVQGPGYACMGAYKFTSTGVFEWDKNIANMWQYSEIDWTKNAVKNEIALVVKDSSGNKIEYNDPNMYPMDLHYTVTLVSKGSTYTPPTATVDAGTPPVVRPDAGAPVVDAGHPTPPPGVDAGTGSMPGGPGTELGADAGVPAMPPASKPDAGGAPEEATGCTAASGALGTSSLFFAMAALALGLARRRRGR